MCLSPACVAAHDEQCVKALLTKELITFVLYLSGHSLAPFRQKPKFVGLTYTSVENVVVPRLSMMSRKGSVLLYYISCVKFRHDLFCSVLAR